jgi:pimeloyl-ACP methyl ester carboxylesterase
VGLRSSACLLAIVACLILSHPGATRAAPLPVGLPGNDAFRHGPCPIGEPADLAAHGIECGVLTVPERHAVPGGPTIELAVAVIHARDTATALEPVIHLAGGPGESAVLGLPRWAGSTLTARHDLILLDQRGTGYSRPSLACRQMWLTEDPRLPTSDYLAGIAAVTTECRARLVAAGVDVSAYSTNESAADVEALRVALGIERWSLYGISYGTRLALEVMRDHPAAVASAILDSAYPPNARSFEDHGARLDRAFDAVVAGCRAEPACAARFPDLGARFGASLERLEAEPWESYSGLVPGHTIAAAVRGWMYDTRLGSLLPALIDAADRSDPSPFLLLLDPPEPRLMEEDSRGMNLSVECAERGGRADAAAVAADLAAHPRWRVLLERDWYPVSCAAWSVPPADASDVAPVTSSIPTLILAGELDPVTPPEYADLAASTLARSTVVRVPGFGHAVTLVRCPSDLRDAFLAAPDAPLDTSCLAGLFGGAPRYVTDTVANAGLGRMYHELLFGPSLPAAGHWLLAGYVAAVFALWIAGWVGGGARSRPRRAPVAGLDGPEPAEPIRERDPGVLRGGRLLGLGAIFAHLVFVAGLAIILAGQPEPLRRDLGLPAGAGWLLAVATLASILGVGLVALAIVALATRAGRRRSRLALVLHAVACAIVSGTLIRYGVIWG